MIVTRNLTKRFGRLLAVDALNLQIAGGQVVGFLGPNGAGKTTAIRMITGFLPPTSGTVEVDGLDVARHRMAVRRRIGYLPESTPLYTEMRVREFLQFRAKLFGVRGANRRAAIERVIERCWLKEVARRPISQLSKGFRQRVGLAATMLHNPPVLVLDEPTVGLDPNQIREVRQLIRQLGADHLVLLSTHILPEVELTCDRAIMIARGRIRGQGTLDELRARASESARYVLEVDSDTAEASLRGVKGVRAVQALRIDDRWRRLLVDASGQGDDLREALMQAVMSNGATVRELRRDTPTLEYLFVQMVAEAEGDFARRSEAAV